MEMGKALHMNDILNSPLNKKVESVNSSYVAKMMNGGIPKPDIPVLQKNGAMHIHIEIHRFDKSGAVDIKADIDNQEDLEGFFDETKGYMPSVGIMCRIKEMFHR
jgi:hypothetical protein